jgi:hypothetical protein
MLQANPVSGNRERARSRASPGLSLRAPLLLLVVASVLPLLGFSLGGTPFRYRTAGELHHHANGVGADGNQNATRRPHRGGGRGGPLFPTNPAAVAARSQTVRD